MLIGGIAAVGVFAVALVAVVLTRRMSHDDVHSVEGYHRSLHTLEHINTHQAAPTAGEVKTGNALRASHAAGTVKVAGSHTVRVTEMRPVVVAPVPPPPVDDPDVPVVFDDAGETPAAFPEYTGGRRDRAMISMNRRPRRLAAPALAVAAVSVLIVVLVVIGSHSVPPRHHGGTGSTRGRKGASRPTSRPEAIVGSPTTTPPAVSPQSVTSHAASYDVAGGSFTLVLSATSGACWVDATSTTSGATLFAGTLQPGQQHALAASGGVSVTIGAPTFFVASVDGTVVSVPAGSQTPFTMQFLTPGGAPN